MEAVIFVGIQAAGKSSFYKHHFFNTHVRINLDMLKTRHRENILFQACLTAQQPLVVDNTNLLVAQRAKYIESAKAVGFRVIGYYFAANPIDAMRRNQARTGSQRVPDAALFGAHKQLQPPTFQEGFDQLYRVELTAAHEFHVEAWPHDV